MAHYVNTCWTVPYQLRFVRGHNSNRSFLYHDCFLHLVNIRWFGYDATSLRIWCVRGVPLHNGWSYIIGWTVYRHKGHCLTILRFCLLWTFAWHVCLRRVGLVASLANGQEGPYSKNLSIFCVFGVDLRFVGERSRYLFSRFQSRVSHDRWTVSSCLLITFARFCSALSGHIMIGRFSRGKSDNRGVVNRP